MRSQVPVPVVTITIAIQFYKFQIIKAYFVSFFFFNAAAFAVTRGRQITFFFFTFHNCKLI